MIRRRDIVALSALAILVAGIGVLAVIAGLTQTAWGRDQMRRVALAELRRLVHGRIYVGRLDGTLFTNLTIDSVEIRDRQGQLFLATGRLHAEYDPRDLLDRRILIQQLEVDNPTVYLIHHHDESWNFAQIFGVDAHARPKRPTPGAFGTFIVATHVTLHNGAVFYDNRWSPDDSLHGVKRERAIAQAIARPYSGLSRTPEGYMRRMAWTGVNFASLSVRVADPDSAGLAFRFDGFDANEYFPPFNWTHARGHVEIAHDTLRAILARVQLPGSVVRGGGTVYLAHKGPPHYALRLTADTLALTDIDWVYPNLPRAGGGSAVVEIRSDHVAPEIMNYGISNMDVRTTESRLRGAMTFEVGRPELIIKNLALEAAPVDFELIRVLGGGAPFPVPWAGQWTGRIRGPGGPLSRFRVDTTDLELQDAHVAGATSRLAGSGELDISQPAFTQFHHFRLTVGRLDLRTPEYVLPAFPRLRGIVTGTATLDSVWQDVRFTDARLTHVDGDGPATHVTGSGRYTLGKTESTYDMTLDGAPISFTTLARSYPSLPLRSEFSGPFAVQGTMDNLDLAAKMAGPPGGFAIDGHFNLTSPGRSGSGALILSHLDARALLGKDSIPETDLSGRLDADVSGDSLAGLEGPISGTLAASVVGRLAIDTGRIVGRFGAGRLRVDTLTVASPGGQLWAQGGLALRAGLRDSLAVALDVDSLAGWRPYLTADSAADSASRVTLSGNFRLAAAITGWLDSLGAMGTLEGSGLVWGDVRARKLSGTMDVPRLRAPASGSVNLTVSAVTARGTPLDSVAVHSRFMPDGRTLLHVIAAEPTGAHAVAALAFRQSLDTTMVTLDTLAVYTHDNAWHLGAPAHLRRDQSGATLDLLTMRGAVAGLVTAQANIPMVGTLTARVRADSVPVADVAEVLESHMDYGGLAMADLQMAGDRANPTIQGTGRLEGARFGDVRLEAVVGHLAYADRRLDLHADLLQQGDTALHAHFSVPTDLALASRSRRLLDDSIRGDIRADRAGFDALAAIYPGLENPKGTLAAAVALSGTVAHPMLNGDIKVTNAEAGFPRLGVRFVGMQANLHFAGDSLAVRDVTVNTVSGQRRGRAQLTGWVTFADVRNPLYNLTLTANDLHALSRPRVADVEISTEPGAPLHLTGGLDKSVLSGAVVVDRGTIFLPEMSQKSVVSLDDPELYRLVDTSLYVNRTLLTPNSSSLMENLRLSDVRVSFGSEVWLKSSEANINLTTSRGPLVLRDTATGQGSAKGVALAGTLVAARGTFRLNLGIVQRTFTVDSGTVRFNGTVDINPDLNVSATYVVRQGQSNGSGSTLPDVPIRVVLAGNLVKDSVRLSSSDTVLTQSDLLSYLVTGQQSFTVGQSSNDAQNSLASFVLPTLGTALGTSLSGGIVDVVTVQTATASANQGTNGLTTALTGTRIGAGKQIGPSTFVSADLGLCATPQGVGAAAPGGAVTATSQIGVRVEQQLTRNLSLAASSEPGTKALYCTEGTLSRSFVTTPRQWGLDLFHTWTF